MGVVATRVASPEFIGRRHELEALTDAVRRGTAGEATVVVVGGDAGIGKTRLVDEVAGRARAQGALVLAGGCVSLGNGEGLPFAPIVEAFRRLPAVIEAGEAGEITDMSQLRSSETSDLGRLLPELGPATVAETGVMDRPGWVQARIFEGLLALLGSLGEQVPVVLIVEDLHWADDSTRDVLMFLARNARSERLAVVGTYRTDDLNRRHPLRPWLAEMDRLPRVVRIDIGRFGRSDLDALITAILGHRPVERLLDAIERRAEGNPFFVEELLASAADGPADSLPPTLRDVMLTRVTVLSEDAQRILGYAAVAGRTVDADLLADVAEVGETELEGPLREAVAAQILTIDRAARLDAYRFRHALLAEAVYDDLLPSERRRLHAAYGAVLDARPIPPGAAGASHLAALAHHATAAHEPVRALRAWVRAARAAVDARAFADATRAYERAIELWDAVPADDRPAGVDAADLYHEGALGAMVSGRQGLAVGLAKAAVDRLDPDVDLERWAAANERLARASWIHGGQDEGLMRLQATAARLEQTAPTPIRARILAALAGAHMLSGEHPRAIETARAAIDLARAVGSRQSEAHALNTLGTSTVLIGDCQAGLAWIRDGFAMSREINDVDDIGRCYANLSSCLLICGEAEESLDAALQGVAWARTVGAMAGYGRFIGGNAVDAAVALGRWDEAERMVDELLAGHPEGFGNRIAMITNMSTLYVRRGRAADAEPLLEEGRTLIEPLQEAQFTGQLYVGLVEFALTDGRPDDAVEAAADGLRRIDRTGDRYYQSELMAMATRAEADRAEVARASRDATRANDAITGAAAQRDKLRSWLAESSDRPSFGGQLAADTAMSAAEVRRAEGVADPEVWQEAVLAAEQAGYAWRIAYARYRLAEALLLARAARREAATALGIAWRSADALGARPLIDWIESLARRSRVEIPAADASVVTAPTEAPAPADDHGLTAREREVLGLLVQGHTNKRIAEELFISESTAGVHVSNILGKLGVGTRTEAATVATRLGLVD
jgi:DNA-binding CsgD family transcriptional regulator/tetratricopeptide (TPR) repeat protein